MYRDPSQIEIPDKMQKSQSKRNSSQIDLPYRYIYHETCRNPRQRLAIPVKLKSQTKCRNSSQIDFPNIMKRRNPRQRLTITVKLKSGQIEFPYTCKNPTQHLTVKLKSRFNNVRNSNPSKVLLC